MYRKKTEGVKKPQIKSYVYNIYIGTLVKMFFYIITKEKYLNPNQLCILNHIWGY